MERRREDRVRATGTSKLTWLDGSLNRTQTVALEDIASDGLRVRLVHPVKARQMVRLEGLTSERMAAVRYCERSGEEWVAGLELTTDLMTELL